MSIWVGLIRRIAGNPRRIHEIPDLYSPFRVAFASGRFTAPEAGSLSFMLSKEGYLSDDAAGPWLPHVMFFVPHGEAVPWGAGLAAAKPPFVYSIVAASRGDK